MAKEKKKGKKKKDSGGPREAVRGAVESTFQRAAGGAQELLDDVSAIVKSLRDANLVEALEGLRDEVQTLAKRVAALELRTSEPEKPARPAVRRTPAARKPVARKPAARKPAAGRSAAAKPAASRSTAAKKPASSRSTAAKKPPAASGPPKPRSTRSTRSTPPKGS